MILAFSNETDVRRLDFYSLLHTLSSRWGILARLLSFFLGSFFLLLLFFFSGPVYFSVWPRPALLRRCIWVFNMLSRVTCDTDYGIRIMDFMASRNRRWDKWLDD